MRFVLNKRKAAQAAAYLVSLHEGRMNLMVLLKLLYLSDRRSLIERGDPITGDQMVSMPHGPVLSQIYDSMNVRAEGDPWCEYFREREGYDICLSKNPENDELSEYELQLLKQTDDKFGHMTWWQIRDYTHDLPEWTDPHGSSLPIDPKSILRAEGKNEAEIEVLSQTAEEVSSLRRLLHKSSSAY